MGGGGLFTGGDGGGVEGGGGLFAGGDGGGVAGGAGLLGGGDVGGVAGGADLLDCGDAGDGAGGDTETTSEGEEGADVGCLGVTISAFVFAVSCFSLFFSGSSGFVSAGFLGSGTMHDFPSSNPYRKPLESLNSSETFSGALQQGNPKRNPSEPHFVLSNGAVPVTMLLVTGETLVALVFSILGTMHEAPSSNPQLNPFLSFHSDPTFSGALQHGNPKRVLFFTSQTKVFASNAGAAIDVDVGNACMVARVEVEGVEEAPEQGSEEAKAVVPVA